MPSKPVVIATVVAFALLGFMLNPNAPLGAAVFGAPPAGDHAPTGAQVGALMLVGAIESAAFGLGAAFLLFGLPVVRRIVPRAGAARAAWLAVGWSLVSWVPHTALHMTAGADMAKLIAIEYAFHVTLVLGAAALAWALFTTARARAAPGAHVRGAAAPDAADA